MSEEDTVGTVSVNIFTNERKIMTTEGWKDLPKGEVKILYKTDAPRWFDAVASILQGDHVTLYHNMNDVPYIALAKSTSQPGEWLAWIADAEQLSITNNQGTTVFEKLTVHSIGKDFIEIDASNLGLKYVVYVFSKEGFNQMGVPA